MSKTWSGVEGRAQCVEGQRDPEIPRVIGNLEVIVGELESWLENLEARLEPVLRSETTVEEEKQPNQPPVCGMSCALTRIGDRVRRKTMAITSIMERLEI